MNDRTRTIVWAACIGLAALAVNWGCSQAEAQPLEVTYYYLPG
jgi:hypothetical protein